MNTPLRALLVEDSETDAFLVIEALKHDGYAPVHTRVQTAEAMRNALAAEKWDVVLCDYRMPSFDARPPSRCCGKPARSCLSSSSPAPWVKRPRWRP